MVKKVNAIWIFRHYNRDNTLSKCYKYPCGSSNSNSFELRIQHFSQIKIHKVEWESKERKEVKHEHSLDDFSKAE